MVIRERRRECATFFHEDFIAGAAGVQMLVDDGIVCRVLLRVKELTSAK
ncbi:MAG: hypothetical protein WCS90_03830 [Bacilli bacterium]